MYSTNSSHLSISQLGDLAAVDGNLAGVTIHFDVTALHYKVTLCLGLHAKGSQLRLALRSSATNRSLVVVVVD